MRVFVTGASGHVASAVISELISAAHVVVGLARSDEAAEIVRARGAHVRRGGLADTENLVAAAKDADGVIHLAFDHAAQGAGDLAGAVAADLAAVKAIGHALAGSGKPFVGTNATGGIALAGFSGVLTEDVTLPGGPRIDTVHSGGRYGFVSGLIDIARASGLAGYLGDGSNRWGSTDTRDVAVAYRLALESAPAGTRVHAVAEAGIPMLKIAETIAARLGIPASVIPAEDAAAQFGFLAPFVAMNNPVSSRATRDTLGWNPTRPGLLESLKRDPELTPLAS